LDETIKVNQNLAMVGSVIDTTIKNGMKILQAMDLVASSDKA